MIDKASITAAWAYLRNHNHVLPDEVLDFIKKASMEKLASLEAEKNRDRPLLTKEALAEYLNDLTASLIPFASNQNGQVIPDRLAPLLRFVVQEKIKTAMHQKVSFLDALRIVQVQNVEGERIDERVIEAQRIWFDDHLTRLNRLYEVIE
jgi:hypothetical protein